MRMKWERKLRDKSDESEGTEGGEWTMILTKF